MVRVIGSVSLSYPSYHYQNLLQPTSITITTTTIITTITTTNTNIMASSIIILSITTKIKLNPRPLLFITIFSTSITFMI
ncbi:hypothetical protein E2C01_046601 [Portunus trituberculatus]|uniref:Uncharacterized protein n=1 Tax=Portunus trituberculatus TaxID=210409 RepID=A0A5B7G5I6_PORTR|nr:hypothetical protein [Portunus trituberculatus]